MPTKTSSCQRHGYTGSIDCPLCLDEIRILKLENERLVSLCAELQAEVEEHELIDANVNADDE